MRRKTQGHREKSRPCDNRGRDWSDADTSHGTPGATRSWVTNRSERNRDKHECRWGAGAAAHYGTGALWFIHLSFMSLVSVSRLLENHNLRVSYTCKTIVPPKTQPQEANEKKQVGMAWEAHFFSTFW